MEINIPAKVTIKKQKHTIPIMPLVGKVWGIVLPF
jgi:hypothetical protein